ncbi:long chain fatty acid-CoA ligase [Gordonia sp. KTR9] [Mycolicibacterium parafortuitum]|uniref:Long chain fatty acid-CoA ligase [Gordonia sp. KTR9] n=1 Tax=Mycolicibacterium parafortuitum TaxID=39692 RepID=A0A375YLH3_MYCPF|nr:long-chain fatty acid--CoA ligase [Mycolicibacterium parafortuitum]SRX81990.1 long chain fatty acid-CoA ligase [Gordonia sp. KTR9] [Mycolicibacterium parafortuitum]
MRQSYWPADRSVDLVEDSVGALLARRSAQHPDRPALVGTRHGSGEHVRLTYAQLYTEAAGVATALSRLARPGGCIALWAPNVVEWPIIQYGAALAGVVLVALNPVLREEELDYALTHSGATVLLHADVSRDYAMGEVAARVAARIPGLQRISLSDHRWRAVDPDPGALPEVAPDDVAMLQYTSGTTGRPKGVVLNHRALVNVAKLTMESAAAPAGAVGVNPLPMFHTAGCVIATLGPLWLGGTAVLVERFTPAQTLAVLHAERADVLFYVPAILDALVTAQRSEGSPGPRIPIVMGGASLVSPALIDGAAEVFGATVLNLFGQTELAPVLSMTRPTDDRAELLGTVGRPLPQVDCKIVDPATGAVVAVGEPGEICARGYQQFVEYLHDPAATAAAVDDDGFVRTGDLGAMDDRGYLTVTGRLKDIIIRGGENIAPAEIERHLTGDDRLLDLAVVGIADDRWGEAVAAVIRAVGDPVEVKKTLAAQAESVLSPYKVPSRWFVTETDFPATPTGKVRKFALRDAIQRGELREL